MPLIYLGTYRTYYVHRYLHQNILHFIFILRFYIECNPRITLHLGFLSKTDHKLQDVLEHEYIFYTFILYHHIIYLYSLAEKSTDNSFSIIIHIAAILHVRAYSVN